MSIQFDEFLRKARDKKANEIKVIGMEVKDIGVIEFTRPTNEYILKFMERVDSSNGKFTEEFNHFKELLYTHCSLLQKKELREEFKVNSPYDLVTEIFGINETAELANEFMEKFGFGDADKEETEDIKNS